MGGGGGISLVTKFATLVLVEPVGLGFDFGGNGGEGGWIVSVRDCASTSDLALS